MRDCYRDVEAWALQGRSDVLVFIAETVAEYDNGPLSGFS